MDENSELGYLKELTLCRRLYQELEYPEQLLEDIFKEIAAFLRNKEVSDFLIIKAAFDKDEATAAIEKGLSLKWQPPLNSQAFYDLFYQIIKVLDKKSLLGKSLFQDLIKHVQSAKKKEVSALSLTDIKLWQQQLIDQELISAESSVLVFYLTLSTLYENALAQYVDSINLVKWEGGDCALCGEKPHFGRLRKQDGAKILHCWLCGCEWLFPRIKCPYCYQDDQKELGYFTLEKSELCRVQYCKGCNQYYKLFDARKIGRDDLLLKIHNLATLSIDFIANQEGFKPGSGIKWTQVQSNN